MVIMQTETNVHTLCSQCPSGLPLRYPFCPMCGRLSPSVLERGSFAVEVSEIPSAQVRSEVQAALRNWFPRLDIFEAEKRLKSRSSVLISGINEESGRRILEALRAWKVNGRLVPEVPAGGRVDWKKWILNPGLAFSGMALLSALLVGGMTALLLILVAFAAPLLTGLLRRNDGKPLIPSWTLYAADHHWISIADEYAGVVQELQPADRDMLRSLTSEIFDLMAELASGSVVAVSAGGEEGDLYRTMRESIRRAVSLAGDVASGTETEKSAARQEFGALSDLVKKTSDWFGTLRHGATRPTPEISEQLREVTESIDRIVRDVRSPREERFFSKDDMTS